MKSQQEVHAQSRDFKALGWLVKGLGQKVVFSSALPVAGTDAERASRLRTDSEPGVIDRIFGVLAMGWFIEDQTWWWQTENTCLKVGKSIFAEELSGL